MNQQRVSLLNTKSSTSDNANELSTTVESTTNV